MKRSSRSTPTGPGSRGGRWHEKDFRIEYHRRWRANHPEYREAEALRRARARAVASGVDPALVTESHRLVRLPTIAIGCVSCGDPIPGLCRFCAERERKRAGRRWTPDEDAIVIASEPIAVRQTAVFLRRSVHAVWDRRYALRRAAKETYG